MEGRRSQVAANPKRKAAELDVNAVKTPSPSTKKAKQQAKPPARAARKSLTLQRPKRSRKREVTLDGQTFRVGDVVYIVTDESLLQCDLDVEEDESYNCGVCGKRDQRRSKLLECSRCLGGYHLSCLDPPLKEVPEGDWFCPGCAAGKAPRRQPVRCARERLLQQKGLSLARIVDMWRDHATGFDEITAQWYYLPEETHLGRQHHHVARELFLSRLCDTASVEAILRAASVISMAEYNRCGDIDNDTFVCDYEYDPVWQRFRRHAPWDALGALDDDWEETLGGGASDDEDADATFTLSDALADEHGDEYVAVVRGGPGRRRRQGGVDFAAQLGARSIPEHVRAGGGVPAGPLAQARRALTLAATPASLPCREEENKAVEAFVREVLAGGEGGRGKCLYISGIPGTGKTATVLAVARALRERAQAGSCPPFQFVDINGLRLPSPQHAYSALYEALTGEAVGPKAAAAALEDYFGRPRRGGAQVHTVVLLDELDSLVNRTQTVLYNLFDWPSRPGSHLSIVGIANTMDLPERLHPRIGSRLAGSRLVFHPYQREQLETIMRARLGEGSAFADNALTLIARKVANCSGDVRRSLELCRRAAEIATRRAGGAAGGEPDDVRVTIADADNAIREAFNTPHTAMIRASSRLERLLLAAVHLEGRYTGRAEVTLGGAAARLPPLMDNKVPPLSVVVDAAVSLAARRLLLCDGGHRRGAAAVALNVPVDDLLYVLSHDDELGSLLADRLK